MNNIYRTTIDNLLIGVVVHQSDTSVLLCNNEAERILGLTEDQMRGKKDIDPQWKFVDRDGVELPIDQYPVNQVVNTDQPLKHFTCGIVRHDRNYVTMVMVNANPIFDNDTKKLYQVIVNFVDVTQQKLLENQLLKSQKMEALGTLAGGVAHDFNNILTPILGYTEVILEEMLPNDKYYDMIDRVYDGAKRARSLVKQILSYSRHDDKNIEDKEIRVKDIVVEVLELIKPTTPANIEIEKNIISKNHSCGYIKGDSTQIHQILMNLTGNAFHAIGQNKGKITISCQSITISEQTSKILDIPIDDYVKLNITDTGKGIKQQDIDRIFDPFFTTKVKGEGTGLGLSVVHGIVQRMNGVINVKSTVGKGTTFCIFIPMIKEQIVKEIKSKSFKAGAGHIVIAEDETPIRELYVKVLNRLGYEVSTFPDGQQAYDYYKDNIDEVDLILTDMSMPNMNGIELTNKVKALNPAVPVILCSGYSDDTKRGHKVNKFVYKPVNMKVLTKEISKLI